MKLLKIVDLPVYFIAHFINASLFTNNEILLLMGI